MYNYIPLPTNLRDFSCVVELRINEGSAGYGVYIQILQLLRDMPDYKMSPNPKRIAFVLNEGDVDMVQRVIRNYGLFDFDDSDLMFCPWLNGQMSAYDERKNKMREAGAKGAAKRWADAKRDNGQAIATPLKDNGQAIAYNITQSNITQSNSTQPNQITREEVDKVLNDQGVRITSELVEVLIKSQPQGHNVGYLAQVCMQYGMGENVLNLLQRLTNNAEIVHPSFQLFVATVKGIQAKNWRPNMPANYFLRKLTE